MNRQARGFALRPQARFIPDARYGRADDQVSQGGIIIPNPQNTHITIHVNNKVHHVTQTTMTGAEIKAIANVGPGYELFLVHDEGGNKPDEQIPSDRVVNLRSGMKFRAIPPGNQG